MGDHGANLQGTIVSNLIQPWDTSEGDEHLGHHRLLLDHHDDIGSPGNQFCLFPVLVQE